MVQRKFYLPEDLYSRLQLRAKVLGKTITEVLRELLAEGLKKEEEKTEGRGVEGLLRLAKMAEKNKWVGPQDLAKNHDKYFAQTHK